MPSSETCVQPVLPWEVKQMNSSQIVLEKWCLCFPRQNCQFGEGGYLDTRMLRGFAHKENHCIQNVCWPSIYYFPVHLCHTQQTALCQRHRTMCFMLHILSLVLPSAQ